MLRKLGMYLYRSVLCITGAIAIYWGISRAFTIISTQTVVVERSLGFQYFFTHLGLSMPGLVIFAFLFGALEYVTIGLLLIAFSTLHAKLVYWSCQGALWLLVASFWYQFAFVKQSGVYDNL
jgi:hypothetical protein